LQKIAAREKEFDPSEVRKILAEGGDVTWVLPTGLADTMDKFREFPEMSWIGEAADWVQSFWKQYVLMNPMRVIKYNPNNLRRPGHRSCVQSKDPQARLAGFQGSAPVDEA